MGARHKLNEAYIVGLALLSAFVGLASGSWLVFLSVLIGLLLLKIHAGDIRPYAYPGCSPSSHRWPHRSRPRSRRRR